VPLVRTYTFPVALLRAKGYREIAMFGGGALSAGREGNRGECPKAEEAELGSLRSRGGKRNVKKTTRVIGSKSGSLV